VSEKFNVGLVDRILRLGISAILIYLALYYPLTAEDPLTSYVLLAMGVLNGVVAVIGICPVYMLIGIKTNGARGNDA